MPTKRQVTDTLMHKADTIRIAVDHEDVDSIKGVIGMQPFPLESPHPAWPTTMQIGDQTLHVPLRQWVRMPSVAFTNITYHSQMPNTLSTLAYQHMLKTYPDHIPTMKLEWWK
jgi:hypothetical protein